MSEALPSPASLRSLARAAVARALRQWPAGRRFQEDLEQEAVVAALEALRTWDSSRASWTTWAWWAIKTALRRFLLANIGPVSQPHSARHSPDAPRARGAPLPESLAATVPAPDVRTQALLAVAALLRCAFGELKSAYLRSPKQLDYTSFVERDVAVLCCHHLGEPVASLAERFALSRQGVYDVLARTRSLSHFAA
jgi:hypothetical protein